MHSNISGKFIDGISVKAGKVVNFSTAALVKSTYKQVAKLSEKKKIPLAKEEFSCKGYEVIGKLTK